MYGREYANWRGRMALRNAIKQAWMELPADDVQSVLEEQLRRVSRALDGSTDHVGAGHE